jgi:hypothetical protein
MRSRNVLWLVLMLVVSACNLTANPNDDGGDGTQDSTKPSVEIIAPLQGDEIVVNTRVLVSITATDTEGVTRAQLAVDGEVVRTAQSEASAGETLFDAVLEFTPREVGEIEISVVAYRSSIPSDPAVRRLTVRQSASQVTQTPIPQPQTNVPVITPNDPTCRIVTTVNLNLRSGPDTIYPVITILNAGAVLPITGRIASNQWWQVRYSNVGNAVGWVSAAFVLVYGNCALIPVVPIPPTPIIATTAAPPPASLTPTRSPTPPTPTLTLTPGTPDLVIASIVGEQTVVLNGAQTREYSVTITNTGSGAAGQFSNRLTVQPGNVIIDLGAVGGLNAGQSILLQADVTFESAGNYSLAVQADSNAQVNEFSEVNNSAIYNVTVTLPF